MNKEKIKTNLVLNVKKYNKQIQKKQEHGPDQAVISKIEADNRQQEDFSFNKCNLLHTINDPDGLNDNNVTLEVEFFPTNKKKMHKKTFGKEKSEHMNIFEENSLELDYNYNDLLKFVFEILTEQNPATTADDKFKLAVRPPQVFRFGTKKTVFMNFIDIAKSLHRAPNHLLKFLLVELGTSGSLDGNQQLIIKGRFESKQIENVLRRYIKEYVKCRSCCSYETHLQKEKQLFFLKCGICGTNCSVSHIMSGFRSLTDKRKNIRAKVN